MSGFGGGGGGSGGGSPSGGGGLMLGKDGLCWRPKLTVRHKSSSLDNPEISSNQC